MIFDSIKKLIIYGLEKGLIEKEDVIYTQNMIIDTLGLDEYVDSGKEFSDIDLEETLSELLDYAGQKGIIENSPVYRDLFDTKLMGLLTERPSSVIKKFNALYKESPEAATDYFYKFSCDTDYIRRYRIKKDVKWTVPSKYGEIDITINLSKPEKDPKAIAAAKSAKQSGYPKCNLCRENEGYAGTSQFPCTREPQDHTYHHK